MVVVVIGSYCSKTFLLFLPQGMQLLLQVLVDRSSELNLLLQLATLRLDGTVLLIQRVHSSPSGDQVGCQGRTTALHQLTLLLLH